MAKAANDAPTRNVRHVVPATTAAADVVSTEHGGPPTLVARAVRPPPWSRKPFCAQGMVLA
eukprot:gene5269-36355_t